MTTPAKNPALFQVDPNWSTDERCNYLRDYYAAQRINRIPTATGTMRSYFEPDQEAPDVYMGF